MKKILSLFVVACMLCSMSISVFADGYSTQISVEGNVEESYYEVTVPIQLTPGESGDVAVTGAWLPSEKLVVTCPNFVTLTSDRTGSKKDLRVTFNGIDLIGDEFETINVTRTISVEDMQVAIGKWTGTIVYSVKFATEKVPVGATYYRGLYTSTLGDYEGATTVLTAGDLMPLSAMEGDVFVYEDYEYRYDKVLSGSESSWVGAGGTNNYSELGWGVAVLDTTKSEYSTLQSTIAGASINALRYTFSGCTNMTVSPTLPDSVENITGIFSGCTSLISAPILPISAHRIDSAFAGCTSLTGEVNLSYLSFPTGSSYTSIFFGTKKEIVLVGNHNYIYEIAALYDNVSVKS